MIVNRFEFLMMNNPLRAFLQDHYEGPRLRKVCGLGPGKHVLEIGCGNGNGSRMIMRKFKPALINAIDLDEKMIRLAKKKNRDLRITFEVGEASSLRFEDGQFDAAFDFGIIHHIPNWRDCLSEMHRVLKEGGLFIAEDLSIETFENLPGRMIRKVTDHPYKEMYTKGEFISHLKRLRFEILYEKSFNPLGTIKHFLVVAKKDST